MQTLLLDLELPLHQWLKNPGFTAVVVLTLALSRAMRGAKCLDPKEEFP